MLTAFVDTLGAFLVLALLPFYASELGAGAFVVGALVSSFALAQTVSAPVWGRLSDRIGRRPVILAGLALQVVAYVVFAWAGTLWLLLVSRLAQGLGGGTVSVVFAYVSDAVPAERRAESIGWVTAATSAAAMIGPVIGSVAGRFDHAYPGLIAAGLCLAALIVAWVVLIEPRTESNASDHDENSENGEGGAGLLTTALDVARSPLREAHFLIWTYVVGMLATNATLAVVGLLLGQRFAIDADNVWWFFSVLAGASMVTRIWLLGPMIHRLGELRVLQLGMLLLGLGVLALALVGHVGWLALPGILMALGQSFLYPCTTARISKAAESSKVGLTLGVQQSYGGLARITGPLVAGALFTTLASAPFVTFGILALIWSVLARYRLGVTDGGSEVVRSS